MMPSTTPPIFGVVGWKKSGKTTLVAALIAEFTARGYTVAAMKHAHHAFDIDHPGRDSHAFREAGARQVAIGSARRWALMTELSPAEPEPPFAELLAHLGPCDLVLVEGWKGAAFPKIEARSARTLTRDPLAKDDPWIVAVANDEGSDANGLPVFALDDTAAIADFIQAHLGLERPARRA